MNTEPHWKKIYLFGFMSSSEATSVVVSDLGHNFQLSEIRERWLSKIEAANRLAQKDPYVVNDANLPLLVNVPKSTMTEKVTEARRRLLETDYWRSLTFSIRMVSIDHMIALQSNINLDRVERFLSRVSHSPTSEELFDACLDFERNPPQMDYHVVGANAVVFSSDDEDLRVGNPQVRLLPQSETDGERAKKEVPTFTLPVLGGGPFVTVIRSHAIVQLSSGLTEMRYWLTLQNGFHRAYAFKSLGINQIPCIVIEPKTAQESNLLWSNWAPERQQQITQVRPPLLKDFFNSDVAETLSVRARRTAWKVSWQTERMAI